MGEKKPVGGRGGARGSGGWWGERRPVRGAEVGPRQLTRPLSPRSNTPGSAGASLGPALKVRAGGGPEADSAQSRAGEARLLANESVSGGRALLRVFPTPAGPGGFGDAPAGLRRPNNRNARGGAFRFHSDKLLPAGPGSEASAERRAAGRGGVEKAGPSR